MNKRFAEIYGWSKEILTDVNSFFEHVYPDEKYRKNMIEMITADLSSKNPQRMNWEGVKITTQTGDTKIVNAKNIPVYEQNLMISTVVDVTDRIQAETRLAESEHNYRLLFQKSPQPMWIYNPENLKIIEVNNAAVKHYGYSRKEFYEMNLMDIRPEEDRETDKTIINSEHHKQLSEAGEFRHLKKSGEVIYVRVSGAAINYFGKDYRFILVNDITEQKKAEEMVLASIVEGENKERSRIAQELHDGLGQYLAAANMNFDSLKNSIENFSKKKQDQFKNGLNLLKNAIAETGQISRNLMPRVVDDYGLALAIESLVDSYQNNSSISLDYYLNIKGLELPREIQFNLYRIAQEALSNAIKYAEATKINVQLVKDELDLILTIDDNGIGFDVNDKDFKAGLGLQTIKTRTGALGGYFEFDTKPNSGTFLNIVVPINNNTSNADG
jgi:PAS domain S-box-containing protein